MTVDFAAPAQRPYAASGVVPWYLPQPAALQYSSIRYGDGVIIALAVNGAGNQIARSIDGGLSWQTRAEPNTRQWTGLAYCGQKRWAAVAQSGVAAGQAMYSVDHGLNWQAANMPVAAGWQDCAYSNGTVVAVGRAGLITDRVARSLDGGQTWALAAGGAAALRDWRAVWGVGNIFNACAYDGVGDQMMRSVDAGQNWATVAEAATMQWSNLRYDPVRRRWVAVAFQSVNNNVQYSDNDGVSWTQGFLPNMGGGVNADWSAVAWGNGRWCAVSGNIGQHGSSLEGSTWIRYPYMDAQSLFDVDYCGDRFIACGLSVFALY